MIENWKLLEKLLLEWFDDLSEIIGACALLNKEAGRGDSKPIFFYDTSGASGKSTFLKLLRSAFLIAQFDFDFGLSIDHDSMFEGTYLYNFYPKDIEQLRKLESQVKTKFHVITEIRMKDMNIINEVDHHKVHFPRLFVGRICRIGGDSNRRLRDNDKEREIETHISLFRDCVHNNFYYKQSIFKICTALQPLNLPAFVTLKIINRCDIPFLSYVRLHKKWQIITTIKHFHPA